MLLKLQQIIITIVYSNLISMEVSVVGLYMAEYKLPVFFKQNCVTQNLKQPIIFVWIFPGNPNKLLTKF